MIKHCDDVKIKMFLQTIYEESKVDVPYHFLTEEFMKKEEKVDKIIEKLKKKKFQAARSHFSGKAIRTNATIKDLLRI